MDPLTKKADPLTFSTAAGVAKIRRPDTGKADYRDSRCPGLFLRISASGARTFRAVLKVNGKTEMRQLGHAANLSLEDARALVDQAKERNRAGLDPWEGIDAERKRDDDTFEAIAKTFMRLHVERECKPTTARDYKRVLQDGPDTKPLRDKPLRDITRRDIEAVLDGIEERGRLVAANRARAYLSKFFNWAAGRGYYHDDEPLPTARVARRLKNEPVRTRTLSLAEARAVWDAAGAMGYPWGAFFRLLLLTGQRRGEVAGMKWAEIDGDLWTQAENKASRRHLVPLVPAAVAILAGVEKIGDTYVFTSTGKTPVSGFSKALRHLNAELAKRRKADPEAFEGLFAAKWSPHDLRRTVATELSRLRISGDVISAVLNHAPKGVTGRHYDHYDKLDEKRAALEVWARALLEPAADNVVPLVRAEPAPAQASA